jgi:folate-binding protein YgfZ
MSTWQEVVAPKTPLQPVFPGCSITDLSHLGLIRARGPDVRTFLQGQLTNDIKQVTPAVAQLSSYCSPKGRMLASFWIFQRGEDLYLQLPADRLAAILKRLRMFVLRSQVTLEEAGDELVRFGLAGDCAADMLPSVPTEEKSCLTVDGLTVIRLPGDRPRFEVLGPPPALAGLWAEAAGRAEQTGPDFWRLMDIRAGIPNVYEDTVEAFVPQMANLQIVGGVSFTKGCYTGQEVVARMQYLGKLKRRMYRGHIDCPELPLPGTEIYSAASDSGQGAGRVVDAAPAPGGGFEALVVLQISVAEAGGIHLNDREGPILELLDLPYEFPAVED